MPLFGYNYGDTRFSWLLLITLVLIWTIFLKGLSLWKSARNSQKGWFVALLIINTLGLLEIIYLLFFQKKSEGQSK